MIINMLLNVQIDASSIFAFGTTVSVFLWFLRQIRK